jgi:predicted translin family RNA/ssDNA-binding protein
MPESFAKFVAELLAYSGGAAGTAYLLFQFLGKTWIENKFSQKLEQLKHQQALEVQRLRVEIDSMLSGAIKLQDREFDVLPRAWQKLDEAHGLVGWLVSPLQTYPDLDRMDSQELSEFLGKSELAESEKQRISGAAKKTKAYRDIIFWHHLADVRSSVGQLRDFVAANGIFLPLDLKENFTKVVKLLWSALSDKELGFEVGDFKMQREGWDKIKNEVEPLYKSIETEIHTRLQSHAKGW